ncbi:terminase large subunit domain-containing protein [Maricurvus nonylphenolicus]|uniref:terminase large subunit domain-containing protein n=1 Tax=Maricurvus nonylphenolicus TaxID=1008307 RepID=UPI0036F19F8D
MNSPTASTTVYSGEEIPPELRDKARNMYWAGFRVAQISKKIGVNAATIHSWKKRDEWDSAPVVQRVESSIDARLVQLIAKDDKTDGELKEIEVLTRSLQRTARIRKFDQGGNETDLNPKIKHRNKPSKRRHVAKNEIDEEALEKLESAFFDSIFPHQKEWHQAGLAHAIRQIVKSRQIGATFYFAREAVLDAAKYGRNKLFISASKAQAHVFKRNIINFVREATGIELKGDPIVLANGAEMHFLGTNKNTAQSYSGDLYIDECFWIPNFQQIEHVASGMAVLDDRRLTYFSTPSSVDHPAYPTWSGEHFNVGRPKDDHIYLDVSHKALKDGRLCEDGHWRQLVTIEDAIDKGYDVVTMEKLRLKFPPAKFDNLLMCKFVDGATSVFSLSELQKCMVDSWEVWSDYKPFAAKPLGDRPVWVGYDPSRSRDDACLAVVAPPLVEGGKYRLIEKITLQDKSFEDQAKTIHEITTKYNVEYMGIDASGMGLGVYELVKKFYPAVTKIVYNVDVKNRLVLKSKQLIGGGQFEYDAGDKDLTMAFMTINKNTTGSGQISYAASRTASTGHADEAWAVMHALDKVQFSWNDESEQSTSKNIMEIS